MPSTNTENGHIKRQTLLSQQRPAVDLRRDVMSMSLMGDAHPDMPLCSKGHRTARANLMNGGR